MKRLLARLRSKQNSIAFKLLCITILLIFCPVLFVAVLTYTQFTGDYEQRSGESNYQTIAQLSYSLNSYLSGLFQFSSTIYYNNDLMTELEKSPDTPYDTMQKQWMIEEQLDETLINPRSDTLSAYVMSNGTVYHAGRYNTGIDAGVDYTALPWYKAAVASDEPIYVATHVEELIQNPHRKVFSIVRRVNSIQKTGKMLGVLKLDVDYSTIASICDKIKLGDDSGLLIEDQNNSVIYKSFTDKTGDSLDQLVRKNTQHAFTANINGQKYIISSIKVETPDWRIISLNSVKELNKAAARTRDITFLIAFLSAGIAICILLLYARSFLKPLLQIVQLMKRVQDGDLQVFFPDRRKDEIGYLGASFNKMVRRIDHMLNENTQLVRQVYESKLLQNEAQINALNSQIKPHFLFNTLNMISLLIRCDKDEVALDNLERLSDLLRGMTQFDRVITLKEELHFLDAYLTIQSTRYQDRLTYSIEIDERLNSYRIPALILQPIVENSIVHGCEKKSGKTTIRIYSQIRPDAITITVTDDANGMTPEILAKLRERLTGAGQPESEPPAESGGIGLRNVNRRIQLKYGEQYGLTVDSTENIGTTVVLTLPKPEYLEEEQNVSYTDR